MEVMGQDPGRRAARVKTRAERPLSRLLGADTTRMGDVGCDSGAGIFFDGGEAGLEGVGIGDCDGEAGVSDDGTLFDGS